MIKKRLHLILFAILFIAAISAFSQPEVTAWGNMTGIRTDGQLMDFESSIVIAGGDWTDIARTAKERQRPAYERDGDRQLITTQLKDLQIREWVESVGVGKAKVELEISTEKDTNIVGAFFSVKLPRQYGAEGTMEVLDPNTQYNFPDSAFSSTGELLRIEAKGIKLNAPDRWLIFTSSEPVQVIVRKDPTVEEAQIEVLLGIFSGAIQGGEPVKKSFNIEAGGAVDRDLVTMELNTRETGHVFDGFGGNFRLQNPKTDPQVIQYCLENMRIAWARVEMPWRFWQPEEDVDPIAAAKNGNLHERVRMAMEMAQRLHELGIPVMLADWAAPDWAIVGNMSFRPQPGGLRGNTLDPEKMDKIYKSIGDYVLFLKDTYGVEARMFSFNESDLGIYVRQTGDEHRQLIKGLGAYFQSRGLATKLLLGDTADANGWPFLEESIEDPSTYPYIGAVSFHSWRGWETETLQRWRDAADRVNKPLVVGEGSTDAAAWRYPAIFEEQVYILHEINLYIRIMAICQPRTILQWQLTADYSPMAGGGIFGDEGPLRPTQRFWNFKQLSITPAGLAAMPVSCKNSGVTCAALGDNEQGKYAIHIVNNGATRDAQISGLPETVKKVKVYLTDSTWGMKEVGEVPVEGGQVNLKLEKMSFTSLISG